jgi:hypothetical protein
MILLAIQLVAVILWFTVFPAVSAWIIFIPLMFAAAMWLFAFVFVGGIAAYAVKNGVDL